MGDVEVCVGEMRTTLAELATSLSVNLPDGISLTSTVIVYGAVMSCTHKLVKPGDYVRISSGTGKVRHKFKN